MSNHRSTLRRTTGRRALAVVAVASVAAVAAHEGVEAEHNNFFDLTGWSENEKGELRNHALAVQDLEKDSDLRRHNKGASDVVKSEIGDHEGRRRLLSEEDLKDFLKGAEDEWDADFRKANGGKGRGEVAAAAGENGGEKKPGGVRRKAQQQLSVRNFQKPEPRNNGDFRCIDPNAPLACPPVNLGSACDKYNGGDFRTCYEMCKPSFCCIHDSLSQTYSPSCAKTEPNCPQYFACYIIWWKLHDTVGPANYLRLKQDEPFYNVDFQYILDDLEDDTQFFQQLFGHHFDNDVPPSDATFENPENW